MKDDKKSRISNTTQEAHTDPTLILMQGMMDAHSGRRPGSFIEDMEARGQRELVTQTSQLPTNGSEHPAWAAMGVKFGARVESDPIWTSVTLPPGWKMDGTSHSMWSHLVDSRGRVRGKVFYKAAFYDRSCRIYPVPRYGQKSEYKNDDYDGERREIAFDAADGEKAIFATDYVKPLPRDASDEIRRDYYKAQDDRGTACREFLKKNFPDFENPAAYWD